MNIHLAYITTLIKKKVNIKIALLKNVFYICLNPIDGEFQNWEYKIDGEELFRITGENSISLCRGEEVVQFLKFFK